MQEYMARTVDFSCEPRLSVPDFVTRLWRKIRLFSKDVRQNPEQKAWVQGYWILACMGL